MNKYRKNKADNIHMHVCGCEEQKTRIIKVHKCTKIKLFIDFIKKILNLG